MAKSPLKNFVELSMTARWQGQRNHRSSNIVPVLQPVDDLPSARNRLGTVVRLSDVALRARYFATDHKDHCLLADHAANILQVQN